MKNLNKIQFIGLSYLFAIAFALLTAWVYGLSFPGDNIYTDHYKEIHTSFGPIHTTSNILMILFSIISFIIISIEFITTGETFLRKYYNDNNNNNWSSTTEGSINSTFNFKKYIIWGIIIIFGFYLYDSGKNIINQSAKMYNASKKYCNEYVQKVQEKKGFYDKLWKTYLQKEKITNISKETFIEVTKIIMENRKDGEQIMWKWVQENQQIPYSEFTKFYTDLSNFITEQREGYFNIEKECQIIANSNNTLLDTFPHNIYNKILNCERITFEYGFTSDSTETVFKTKKE
jgi:hypothetical protein